MPIVADFARMSTEQIAERLRTVRADDTRLVTARRVLAEARRLGHDAGLTPTAALARVTGNYSTAHVTLKVGHRVARLQKRAPQEVQARLLVLLLAP
jgi:hypothetical protein